MKRWSRRVISRRRDSSCQSFNPVQMAHAEIRRVFGTRNVVYVTCHVVFCYFLERTVKKSGAKFVILFSSLCLLRFDLKAGEI